MSMRVVQRPLRTLCVVPEGAPLLCAGITTFNALRHSGAGPGDLVAEHYIDSTTQNVSAELMKLGGARVILATLTDAKSMSDAIGGLGPAIDSEDTMDFSVLSDIRPLIEMYPLERAAEAYERMMSGKARFRAVLTTD